MKPRGAHSCKIPGGLMPFWSMCPLFASLQGVSIPFLDFRNMYMVNYIQIVEKY